MLGIVGPRYGWNLFPPLRLKRPKRQKWSRASGGRSQDGMHSSRDECIHLRTNALISGPMLSSRDQCSHLGTNALISGPMLSSRDQCSHLGINALISGPYLSYRDQISHLGIKALLSASD